MQQGHHFFTRRKAGGNAPRLSPRWRRKVDQMAYIIAIAAPFSYAPQVYKIYAGQSTEGLALSSFVILFFINAAWLLYAWIHQTTPLVITSILFCAFHVLIVAGILLF